MLVHKMSYKELSDNRSMNAMLDANIKFRDKGPAKNSLHMVLTRMSMMQMG